MSSEATQIELMIGWLSGLKDDHTPDGYPAVRMSTLTECEDMLRTQAARIASLEAERDQLRARLDRAIGAAQKHFGEDCIRYKLSLFKNGRARNFFPPEMDGNWYAFQRADNDAHIGLCDTIDQLRAEVERLRKDGERMGCPPEGYQLVPHEPTDALLRPFYNCPPDELQHAWSAALRVARVAMYRQREAEEHARAIEAAKEA